MQQSILRHVSARERTTSRGLLGGLRLFARLFMWVFACSAASLSGPTHNIATSAWMPPASRSARRFAGLSLHTFASAAAACGGAQGADSTTITCFAGAKRFAGLSLHTFASLPRSVGNRLEKKEKRKNNGGTRGANSGARK
eukprot:3353178-Pyramimonas_sp.AAC.1